MPVIGQTWNSVEDICVENHWRLPLQSPPYTITQINQEYIYIYITIRFISTDVKYCVCVCVCVCMCVCVEWCGALPSVPRPARETTQPQSRGQGNTVFGLKRLEPEDDRLPPSNVEVQDTWILTSNSLQVLTARHIINLSKSTDYVMHQQV